MMRFAEQIGPCATFAGRFVHWRVVSRMMDALDRFGFTRALIFPYDELDFCRSGTWAGCACVAIRLRRGRNALFL